MEVEIKKLPKKNKSILHEEILPFVYALIIVVIAINAFAAIQNLKVEEPKPIITQPQIITKEVDNTKWVEVKFCEKGRGMCDPPKIETPQKPVCPEDNPYYYGDECHKHHHHSTPTPVIITTNLTINDTAAPIIMNVTTVKINNTININWTTNILANSKIYNQTDTEFVMNHSMNIQYVLYNITLYNITSCNIYENCTTLGPYNINDSSS